MLHPRESIYLFPVGERGDDLESLRQLPRGVRLENLADRAVYLYHLTRDTNHIGLDWGSKMITATPDTKIHVSSTWPEKARRRGSPCMFDIRS